MTYALLSERYARKAVVGRLKTPEGAIALADSFIRAMQYSEITHILEACDNGEINNEFVQHLYNEWLGLEFRMDKGEI